jgi:hypothetical protein
MTTPMYILSILSNLGVFLTLATLVAQIVFGVMCLAKLDEDEDVELKWPAIIAGCLLLVTILYPNQDTLKAWLIGA